jgi:short-subunit dehydrogenase
MEQVVITGAGSGIGRELTKLFLADGSKVLAVSLLSDELASLQQELDPAEKQLSTLVMDLSTPEAPEALFDNCRDAGIDVDVIVNNAGFACYGDVVDENWPKMSNMLDLNIRTLTRLSMLFGQTMKAKGSGDILNVGSTAGMVPAARFAAYGASKAYVNNFSFALRAELRPFGVNVTCLTPAAVATNFAKAAAIDTFDGKSMLKSMFEKGKVSTPDEIALAAYRGLRRGKAQVLTGRGAWMSGLLTRIVAQHRIPFIFKEV